MSLGRTFVALVGPLVRCGARRVVLALVVLVGAAAPAAHAATFTVNTTADTVVGVCDASHCSLREAIAAAAANGTGTPDTIAFNIAVPGQGVATITLTSALPNVSANVTIDGFTQMGSSPNTLPEPPTAPASAGGINAALRVEIVATGLPLALRITSRTVLRGLIIRGATTLVEMSGGGQVRGCYLGTTASGLQAGGGAQGTAIRVDSSADTLEFVIGGSIPADRNVIAGPGTATSIGIDIVGTPELTVRGNLIGVGRDASTVLGHGRAGVRYQSSSSGLTVIDIAVTHNVIGGATAPDGAGIRIDPCTAGICSPGQSFEVFKNYIGTNASLTAVPNRRGIFVGDPVNVFAWIGRTLNQNGNTIRANLGAGIAVAPPSGDFSADVRIEANSITDNGGLGIDLNADGLVSPNAGGLALGQQNIPVITSVTRGGTSTTIAGQVTGIPNQSVRVDLYRSATMDPTGYGEGEVPIGNTTISLSPTGTGTFSSVVPLVVPVGDAITATALTYVTSEFSRVTANLGITLTSGATLPTFQSTNQTVRVTNPSTSSGPAAPVVFRVDLVDGGPDKISCSPGVTTQVFGAVLTFTAPQVLPGGSVQCEYTVSFTTPGVRNVVARLVSSGTFDPDAQNDTATRVFDVNRDTLISLGGRVTTPPGNPALQGTTVTLNGPVARTSTLDPTGRFDFRNVPAGSYTISASAPSWVFSPGYQLLNQVESRSDLNFSARAVFSVSGRATDRSGAPLSGIYLYLSGSRTGQRVTGADGRYEFGPLDYTGTYTIAASSNNSGATFQPRSPQFTGLVGPQTRDFVLVPNRQSFIVNTTDDVGDGLCDEAHCSLRDALTETAANGSGYDVITFDIPGSGVRTITLTQLLPTALGVDINGYTQPGSRQATNATGPIDAVPLIEINGNGLPVALTLDVSRAIGLIVNRAETLIATTAYGEIRGCFLGTTADGLASAGGNQRTAVRADRMVEMVIGTLNPGWRNVIAGDGGPADIGIDMSVQETTSIGGNLIGLAKDGVTVLGHGAAGIRYRDAQTGTAAMVSIGGDGALGNVIGGATAPDGAGIVIAACPGPCPVEDVVAIGDNLIGLTADERLPAANTYGIRVEDQSGATVKVGVGDSVDPNVIRFNTMAGILIAPPTSATSSAVEVGPNRISDNGGLGIDLDGDGPTANDAGDVDLGRQNWPLITAVRRGATTTTIEGTATGPAGAALRLQFFANTSADPSGHGEGERWIGTHDVVLDSGGTASFSATVPGALTAAERVSAIAVGVGSSEFSRLYTRLVPTIQGPNSGSTFQPLRYTVALSVPFESPTDARDASVALTTSPGGVVRAASCSSALTASTALPNGVRLSVPQIDPGVTVVCTIDVAFVTSGARQVFARYATATPLFAFPASPVFAVTIADTLVTLGGRITERGGPPSAPVTVALSGAATRSVQTAADGTYSFANVPAGSYTVTAQALGRAFAPASRVLVDQAASRSDLDFAMSAPLSITGRITERVGGAPVAGVTVSLTGDRIASTTSDASGAYAFPALAAGTYMVTVTQDGRRFDPPSRTLAAITADTAADFQRVPLFTISGTVTDLNGSPVPGVTIGLSGGRSDVATTDANGAYAFSGLPSTNFTVTPARTGFTFSPIPRSIVLLESNEDVSFVAQSGAFARYLAEGATGALFDTQIALFNATGTPATATLTFQKPDGTTQVQTVPLGGLERRTVVPESLPGLEDTAFSTVVTSDQPIAVDRTMTWDDSRYGSHAETGIVQPLTRWFLAEGATTAGFDLFYLVQNPNTTAASVTVRYLLATGAPLEKTYTVPPTSRFNIWVNLEDARLAAAEMSADITSDVPVIVERAMYRTVGTQVFGMGHEGAGVPQQATEWFFAEGATGSFFDLFFLIANPTGDAAQVEATYLKPDGSTVVKTYTVAPNSRFNIWVDYEDPALADTAVGTTFRVTNGVGVVVERAMWWAGESTQWREGHNTAGATQTGEKWALAEGEVTGAPFFTDTFILVANTGTSSGTVRVTLVFEDGTAPVSKDFAMPGSARLNVMASADFPVAVGKRFGTVVESVGATPLPLVVERAMYNRSQGVDFAAGTAALGARLR